MDTLTLLTLRPDTAVHVTGFYVRCAACVAAMASKDTRGIRATMEERAVRVAGDIYLKQQRDFVDCAGCGARLWYGG